MKLSRRAPILVALTWLCVGLAVGVSADVVEDLVFEVEDVVPGEEMGQAVESDDVPIPAARLAGAAPKNHLPLGTGSQAPALVALTWSAADVRPGTIRIHAPPHLTRDSTLLIAQPLRI